MLSVVLPSYNEELMVKKAVMVIDEILRSEKIEHEIIFVDDGSKDGTWREIGNASADYSCVVGVHFSRNFGKEAAIFAGLATSKGDCCVVIDCDLQHPPETIVEMYRLWEQGYEVVEGVKRSRGKESFLHRISAGVFYKLISKAAKFDMSRASDFKLLDRRAVDSLLQLHEKNSFFRVLSTWIGYTHVQVEFDVREREAGESKWTTWSLVQYSITNIVAFSSVPMQMVTVAGIVSLIFAIALGIQTLVRYFSGTAVEGFTTVILLILFIGSLVMLSLGVIGYYIAKIYEELKGRPQYIISKIIGR